MESTNKERSDAIALFEQEEASLQETTGKRANVPVPDDTDAVINGIVEEFFAARVPVDEIPALTPRVKAILFHPSKFLRMGATVQDLCQRLRSVLRILNSNKGEDGEELSWTELEALVPLTDAELFADRVTAARLKSLARSLRVPAVVVAMAEAGVGGVLRPPHFRVRPFLHQSSSAGSQAKKVKEEFGGQLAIILIGKPGCGKTPVLKTMSGPLDENFSWPEPLLVLKQGPPKKQKVKPDVVRDSETLKVCPIYREAMNATTTGVHASEHGHILKIEDEYVNNNKAVRKDPLASGGGSMDNYKKETAELLNFHTSPTGGGGSSGKLVDNTINTPMGCWLRSLHPKQSTTCTTTLAARWLVCFMFISQIDDFKLCRRPTTTTSISQATKLMSALRTKLLRRSPKQIFTRSAMSATRHTPCSIENTGKWCASTGPMTLKATVVARSRPTLGGTKKLVLCTMKWSTLFRPPTPSWLKMIAPSISLRNSQRT